MWLFYLDDLHVPSNVVEHIFEDWRLNKYIECVFEIKFSTDTPIKNICFQYKRYAYIP